MQTNEGGPLGPGQAALNCSRVPPSSQASNTPKLRYTASVVRRDRLFSI